MSHKKSINTGLLLMRITLGVLMFFHGYSKLMHGIEGIVGRMSNTGLPGFFGYGVYIGEVVAPILIVIGFRTRLAALIFAFNMLVAALLSHSNDIFALSRSGAWAIELIGLYFFGALALFFTGAGKYAVSTNSWWD
jgi:putative oxidoreductase